ncbi:hypothetical protein GQ53DRAFT_834450 [Thozetella sp. PMI_491]|nr:hypothetical protein GQ53DRAFT_834450 [Thozetella sp. PMI_491]
MQFTLALAALFAGLVAADTDPNSIVAQVPSCAMTCLIRGAAAVGCGTVDYKCQCTHMTDLTQAVTPCLAQGCTVDEIAKTTTLSAQLCGSLGFASQSAALNSMTATMTGVTSVASATTKSNSTVTTGVVTATRNAAAKPDWMGMGALGAGAALLVGLAF